MNRIQQLSNESLKNRLIKTAFSHYAELEPDAALEYIERYEFDDESMKEQLIATVAARNPLKALFMVEAHTQQTGSDGAMRTLLSSWAKTEPQQAIAYIDTLTEEKRLPYYQMIYGTYLRNQPEAALDWVISRFDEDPTIAGTALRQSISPDSVDYAVNVLKSTNSAGIRSSLIPGIAAYKAGSDPRAALDWLEGFQNEPGYESALLQIVQRMSQSDPEEAAAAIAPILNSDLVDANVGNIAFGWYQKNPQESLSWVDQLPNNSAKEIAITRIIHSIHYQDPDLAASYLSMIQTPFRKEDASIVIAMGYLKNNAGNVENIIAKLDMTQNAAAKVRDAARQYGAARRP